eukprot:Tamp_02204.p1 GENE.Tamp_02204~~Tamp_02204.p1  ORF type:complete len:959 (+),score=270.76 Tamp_02204:249-2879(+)
MKTAAPSPAQRPVEAENAQAQVQQIQQVQHAQHAQQQARQQQQQHFLRQAQPLPLTVAPQDALPAGWDQMAVPLNQLGQAVQPRARRMRVEPRTLQALEGRAEDGDEEKKYGELTPTAGWPRDLAGATGDDTSWIVGMHREPLWSDSMTRACGLTDPCPTGRADRGHGMQMDTNPYNDKRRTFDPYAYGDPYADAATREVTPGRRDYPWDPTRDAQFYGKEGADCSDGDLRDECYERPELDDLRKKQANWMKKYDEFSAPKPGEREEEEEEEEWKEAVQEEKSEEAKEAAAKQAQEEKEAAMKKDGLNGALLHMPEVTPWARSIKTGMLAAEKSVKAGVLHASAAVKATAKAAAADAQAKKEDAHFVGGEPVFGSLGKVVDKVKAAYKEGKGFFSEGNLSELERKFLRARQQRQQQELAQHQALRAFDSSVLHPVKSSTTVLAAISASAARSQHATSASTRTATGNSGKGATIWESPAQVAAHGVYGSAQAKKSQREKANDKQRAAASKVLAAVSAQSVGPEGPLPQVRDEAIKVAQEAEEGAETLLKKVTGRKTSPWVEANIQKGVLRKQSTTSNLMQLVKEHDDKLLKEASGLSAADLKKALASADRDSKAGSKKAKAGKALAPWEEKVAQQGTLRHETVEQNLKAALKAREKMLWKDKTGWKSMKDMQDAEAFADNLEREIKMRRQEESSHPLMPSGAKSLLTAEGHVGAAKLKSASPRRSIEEVQAKAKEALEQRELDRLREGEPLVKALQAEVENDEQELTEEAKQQSLTLEQLHRDQDKLNKQLKLEENIPSLPQALSATQKSGVRKAKSADVEVQSAKEAKEVLGKTASETPPRHGFSGSRAKDDLNEYFAKQEVGGDLSHPAHRTGQH